jgi:E3 Ubiquitin ligase
MLDASPSRIWARTVTSLFLATNGKELFWPIVGVGAGLYLFYRGFRLLQRKRLILNTPTSKIRSASLGLVEISGLATGPYTMPAPITAIPCYYARTVGWQWKQQGKNRQWVKFADESRHVPFYLDDNTGRMLIDPQGAEMEIHCDFKEEYNGSSLFLTSKDIPQTVSGFLARHAITDDRKVKIEEYCIKPKNALFVLGSLTENPGLNVSATPISSSAGQHTFTLKLQGAISPEVAAAMESMPGVSVSKTLNLGFADGTIQKQVIRLSSSSTSENSGDLTQQGKIAAAMMKAGITNPAAWEAAGLEYPPRVSTVEAQPTAAAPAQGFDLTPNAVLMKGTKDPTFFISWRSQREVVKSLGWKSVLMIWCGPLLAIGSLYILAAQLGWL